MVNPEELMGDPDCPICEGMGWVAVDEGGETDIMESEDSMRCPNCGKNPDE